MRQDADTVPSADNWSLCDFTSPVLRVVDALLRASPDLLLVCDRQGTLVYVGEAAMRAFGRSPEAILGKGWATLGLPTEVIQQLDGDREHVFASAQPASGVIAVAAAGGPTEIEYVLSPVRNSDGDLCDTLFTGRDVTERNRAQVAQRRMAAIVASSEDAIIGKDLDGIITSWNQAAERIFGYTAGEVVGRPKTILFPPDRLAEETAILERLRAGKRTPAFETVRLRKDGSFVTVSASISPIVDAHNRIIGASTILRDISKQKQAEQAMRESRDQLHEREARLSLVVAAARLGIFDYSPATGHMVCDETCRRLFGLSQDNDITLNALLHAVHPDDRAAAEKALRDALAPTGSGEYRSDYRTIDPPIQGIRHVHAEGQTLFEPVDRSQRAVRLVGTVQDVTEHKRLEDQLLQAQKLESVGRLAGGVAHDFNNLLTAILGYTDLAQLEGEDDARRRHLANVREAGERASQLTKQLLAFARRQVIEPRIVFLNDLIARLETMLRRLINENIALVMRPAADLHAVKVDPGQFEQILVNLVVNARDAMPDGGQITIETQNMILDEDYARQHDGVVPGEYVMLAVSDTGSGMDEAVKLHIFEPFFTTKEMGRGTGLGLATVYGIVKQAGGHIWLYSEPGEGTTFRIYLPRTVDTLVSQPAAAPRADLPLGTETILLVEDDGAVRSLAALVLRGRGYTVLEAADGVDALAIASGKEADIALLITDVVMPNLSGKAVAERLLIRNPQMKVVYASGYTEDTVVQHGVLDAGVAFLPKPFTPTSLARKVRQVLDGR